MRFAVGLIAVAPVAVGLIAVALATEAQPTPTIEQETARARQLLQSTIWADKAWGAYFAGRLHSQDLREPLIAEFRTAEVLRDAPPWTEQYGFVAALFDAAIEAGITVPAQLLEPFEEKWSDPVLILLARAKDAGSEDSLLRLGDEKSREIVWLAANDLLFERKSQRWYTRTVAAIKITHRFDVTDPDSGLGGSESVGGGECGDGAATMPKGFPPVAIYTLRQGAARGSALLAKGPQNVYYERTVVPTDQRVGIGSCGARSDRTITRIGFLADLGDLSSDQALKLLQGETHIPYRSSEDFQRQVDQSLQAQIQGIRELLEKAKMRGFEAGPDMHLQIVPEVVDQRRSTAGPLPTLAPREIGLN